MKNKLSSPGFTLIELLVVIAIIAILAAILFPVFARAREKARQTTCMNNQRQIIMSLSMYAQDHEETFPSASSVWRDINITTDSLYCPTNGKKAYGYVYNSGLSNLAVGDVAAPDQMMATSDGTHTATLIPSITYDNVAYSLTDFAFRHSNKLIATYIDGHVGLTDKVGATGSVLWVSGDSSVTISGTQVTSWASTVGSLKLNASDTTSTIDFTTLNGHPSIKIAPRASWGSAFCSPSMASLGINDFTVFVVYQLPDPPGTNPNGVYIWNMNQQGSSWCAGVNSLYVSTTGAVNAMLNGSGIFSSSAMTAANLKKPHVVTLRATTGSGSTMWIDGTKTNSSASAPPALNPWYFMIGNGYNVNTAYIGEIIYYAESLTNSDVTNVTNTLKNKYNL